MRTKGCSRNYADTLHGNCFWFLKQHNNFGNIITFVQMQDLRIGPTTTQSRSKFLIHFCAAEIVYSCPHSALLTLASHNRIEPSHGLLHSFWAGETWEQLAIRSEWGQIGHWPECIGQKVNFSVVDWCHHTCISKTVVLCIILHTLIVFFSFFPPKVHL